MTIVTGLLLHQGSDPLSDTDRDQIDVIRAICMAAMGEAEAVRTLMTDAQPRWRRGSDRNASLPFEWIECRIAVHLGDLDQAIPRLEAIRRWLSGTLKHDEICLVSIDLAVAYARKGQAAQHLPGLLADLAGRRDAAENPWVLGSLWRFREELDRTKQPLAAAREAVEIVHRREMSLKGLAARRYPAKIGAQNRCLAIRRTLLGVESPETEPSPCEDWQSVVLRVTSRDPTLCLECRRGHLRVIQDLVPLAGACSAGRSPQ